MAKSTGTGNKSATKDALPSSQKGSITKMGQAKGATKFGFDPSSKVKGGK